MVKKIKNAYQVNIIGIGMGNADTLTVGAKKIIEKSNVLIGAKRMVESFPQAKGKRYHAVSAEDILAALRESAADGCDSAGCVGSGAANGNQVAESEQEAVGRKAGPGRAAVLMSGDVGFYSGAKKLKTLLEAQAGEFSVRLVPGISSLQYFCAGLGISWEDANIVSLHGREGNPAAAVQGSEKTFFLTGSDYPPGKICRELSQAGLGAARVFVGEKLSYEDQQITEGTAEELSDRVFDSLSVMLVLNSTPVKPVYSVQGLRDSCFTRGKVPMTKEEVRAVSLAKLQIQEEDVLYDIGAGTGSVAVEAALRAAKGQVYAVEINGEALELIEENKNKLGAWNLHRVEGLAPQALLPLPVPDKAFIGGSKGNMKEILSSLVKKNPKIRVVVNAIALESLWEALTAMQELGFHETEIVQLSVARARTVSRYHMMTGENPIFIISGVGPEFEAVSGETAEP